MSKRVMVCGTLLLVKLSPLALATKSLLVLEGPFSFPRNPHLNSFMQMLLLRLGLQDILLKCCRMARILQAEFLCALHTLSNFGHPGRAKTLASCPRWQESDSGMYLNNSSMLWSQEFAHGVAFVATCSSQMGLISGSSNRQCLISECLKVPSR